MKTKKLIKLISLSIILAVMQGCRDKILVVVQNIEGPYKTTQMKIKLKTTLPETESKLVFSILQAGTLYWGDGVVAEGKGALSHSYLHPGDYSIEVKGPDVMPSFVIEDIGIVDEIFWPISD